jgi:predicted metal-dependent hydrolase
MSQKIIVLPQIGEVVLAKRRGSKHLRLSVTASGRVRVSLPTWAPYAAGVQFAASKKVWITNQLAAHQTVALASGVLIGKSHRLIFYQSPNFKNINAKVTPTTIEIRSNLSFDNPKVQTKAKQASEKALKQEAMTLLPQRLDVLAKRYGYQYNSVRVRKLTSRWGSCSSTKNITLSYFLMQLPWKFIDYVLLHELIHTKYLHHGADFWSAFKSALPDARGLQKEIKVYKPRIEADLPAVNMA